MTIQNSVQLYLAMPTFLYSSEKLLLCCGYSQVKFEQVQLVAGKKIVGACQAIPYYDKISGKTQKRGFAITGYLKQNEQYDEIAFHLRFVASSGNVEYKVGKAKVKINLQKIEAQLPNSIAIVLPTYQPNINLFKQQVNSILQQGYAKQHPIEIIIQDDGSDKKRAHQIKQYIQQFSNIHFFQNSKNIGFYNNIELLLNKIGEGYSYVAFSDQDDVWHLNKLEKQVEQLKKHQADLVYSDLEIVDENLKQLQATFWVKRSNHINDYHALCVNNVATGSTMLFKTELLSKLLPFPQQTGKVYHDHWICAYLKNKQYKVHYINTPLVKYIQHQHNVTGYKPFKKVNLAQRALSFMSLYFIFVKLIIKKDLSNLNEFITQHQQVYFTNVQRLKLFYVHLGDLQLTKYNHTQTNIILVFRLLFLSFKTIFQKIYLNRFEVSMYSAIVVMVGLQIRYFFRKKNG